MRVKMKLFTAPVVALLMVACSEPQQAGGQAAAQAPEVAVVTLSTSSLALTTELPGRTTDYRQAEIRPQVSGILQQRLFTEGQQVEAGQVLYKIDADPYLAALANAKANLASVVMSRYSYEPSVSNRGLGLISFVYSHALIHAF